MSTSKTTGKKTATRAPVKTVKTTPKAAVPATASGPKRMAVAEKSEKATAALVNPMRKKELIDTVVAQTGVKKRDAKPVVEAVLAEMGEALANGRSLVLPPFGRVRINREKKLADGRVIIAKVRQNDKPPKVAFNMDSKPEKT